MNITSCIGLFGTASSRQCELMFPSEGRRIGILCSQYKEAHILHRSPRWAARLASCYKVKHLTKALIRLPFPTCKVGYEYNTVIEEKLSSSAPLPCSRYVQDQKEHFGNLVQFHEYLKKDIKMIPDPGVKCSEENDNVRKFGYRILSHLHSLFI